MTKEVDSMEQGEEERGANVRKREKSENCEFAFEPPSSDKPDAFLP